MSLPLLRRISVGSSQVSPSLPDSIRSMASRLCTRAKSAALAAKSSTIGRKGSFTLVR